MDATSHKKILKSRDTPARKSIFPRDETFPPAENSLFLPVTRFHLEEIRFSSRRKPFTDGKSIFLPGETFLPARNSLFPPTMHFHLEEIRFSPRRKPSADGQWTFPLGAALPPTGNPIFRPAKLFRWAEIRFFARWQPFAGRNGYRCYASEKILESGTVSAICLTRCGWQVNTRT
jgi:hypothetical protein